MLNSFNLNYRANPGQSQNSLMLSTIAAEQAAGHIIAHVSFSLGRNDLGAFEAGSAPPHVGPRGDDWRAVHNQWVLKHQRK